MSIWIPSVFLSFFVGQWNNIHLYCTKLRIQKILEAQETHSYNTCLNFWEKDAKTRATHPVKITIYNYNTSSSPFRRHSSWGNTTLLFLFSIEDLESQNLQWTRKIDAIFRDMSCKFARALTDQQTSSIKEEILSHRKGKNF